MDYRDGIIGVLIGIVMLGGVMLYGRKDAAKYHYEIKSVVIPGEKPHLYFYRINQETGQIEKYAFVSKDNDEDLSWFPMRAENDLYAHIITGEIGQK